MSKFIKGMDLSTLLEMERCGAKYYDHGQEMDILGPLGHGFSLLGEESRIAVVGGGIGVPPLLELADAIVDIVETGTTLKENGLEVVENVAPISARVIVNLASAKMKKAAIQKVIAELESGLEK